MARQKNRGYQEFLPSYSTPTRTRHWKMASYIRLSKEDLQKIKKGLDCSNSVKNQRDILNYFYQSHWGEASVHPHIHHPGEMFLNCPALGIDMHPLGQAASTDALNPAERVLMQALKEHAIRCLEAMAVIGSTEGQN